MSDVHVAVQRARIEQIRPLAAEYLREQEASTVGPVFARPDGRRRGVGEAVLSAIRTWADDARW